MKEFFKVKDIDEVLGFTRLFSALDQEDLPLMETNGRILAKDIVSHVNLPDFTRSTMDGYALKASTSFGASEGSPAFLTVKGAVAMGQTPDFTLGSGEVAKISTGGMLPPGADSVIMVEYTEIIDDSTIEVYKSVAPGQHVVEVGEDFKRDEVILKRGMRIRAQETGLLAAFGHETVPVFRKPKVAVISTGDEVLPVSETPAPGQIRDINTYSLAGLIEEAGGIALPMGIVKDDYDSLYSHCKLALEGADMVLVSGGSSVGARDFTIEALSALPHTEILAHGMSISPGKPTILAASGGKPFWGLPGHVVSAMVVFKVVVKPFIETLGGLAESSMRDFRIPARLSRNVFSSQGRKDYIRVKLVHGEDGLMAVPVLGKSGMINTMVRADGLVETGLNEEGLDRGTVVQVIPV